MRGVGAERQDSPETVIYNKIPRARSPNGGWVPGSRLVEDQLAEVFGVSRMRVRSVLQALARDKVVTLHKNRGACVAEPTVKEAKEVFAGAPTDRRGAGPRGWCARSTKRG